MHINNIFKEEELRKNSAVKECLTTASDAKRYKTTYYSLDVIISVGYRIKSKQGTLFRIWATNVLKQHLIEGYTINEKRLKREQQKFIELKNAVTLIGNVVQTAYINKSKEVEFYKVDTRELAREYLHLVLRRNVRELAMTQMCLVDSSKSYNKYLLTFFRLTPCGLPLTVIT